MLIVSGPTAEGLALHVRKLDAVKAAKEGTASVEQQQLLATIIDDLEVCLETILNRIEFLKSLVTTEQQR